MNAERLGARRLLVTLPIGVLSVSLLAFNLPTLAGLDPAAVTLRTRYASPEPDLETISRIRTEIGMDGPSAQRFFRFVVQSLRGDFGLSFSSRTPVGPQAWDAFVVSLQMLALTVSLAVVVGLALGVVAGTRHGPLPRVIGAVCSIGASVPAHVCGPLSVVVFGIWLGLLPTGGWGSVSTAILPVATLALAPVVMIAEVARVETRAAMSSDFIRTAQSKGLSHFGVMRHAFAVSRHGVIALAGVMTSGLLSGSVLVETIFSVPGLGRFIVDAVRTLDVPAIQCGLMLAASFSLIVGVIVDIGGELADPRIRRSAR